MDYIIVVCDLQITFHSKRLSWQPCAMMTALGMKRGSCGGKKAVVSTRGM